MKFGILLSATGWTGEGTGYTFERYMKERLEMTRVARDAGFKLLSIGHHLCDPDSLFPQPLPTLAWLAEEARGMLLHTGVFLLSLYHPAIVAEEMATIDTISGGRLVLGVGIGYRAQDYEVLGLRFKDRVERQTEAIGIIKALFANRPVTYHGKHFRLDDVTMYLTSVQKPHPPIWIGTSAETGVRRAARIADGLYLGGYAPTAKLQRLLQAYREELKKAGKPLNQAVSVRREVYLDADRKSARKKALPGLLHTAKLYAQRGLEASSLPKELLDPDEDAELPFLLGNPEDITEQIMGYREELGASHLILRFQGGGLTFPEVLRAVELFGSKVIPNFPTTDDGRPTTDGRR